jgi:hypothetical protein
MKYRINPNYSKIVVIAQTSPTELRGTCPGVEGELHANATDAFQSATGTLKLDVRRFASSDKIRDFGVRTHVDVARHSFAELTQIKIVSSTLGPDGYTLQWQGTFKYRLKTPKVEGEARLRVENGRLYVDASFELPLKDVGLDIPRMLIMKSDVVRIEAKIEAIPPVS